MSQSGSGRSLRFEYLIFCHFNVATVLFFGFCIFYILLSIHFLSTLLGFGASNFRYFLLSTFLASVFLAAPFFLSALFGESARLHHVLKRYALKTSETKMSKNEKRNSQTKTFRLRVKVIFFDILSMFLLSTFTFRRFCFQRFRSKSSKDFMRLHATVRAEKKTKASKIHDLNRRQETL